MFEIQSHCGLFGGCVGTWDHVAPDGDPTTSDRFGYACRWGRSFRKLGHLQLEPIDLGRYDHKPLVYTPN